MNALELRDIHCRLLDGVSLSIPAGESVAILGPSGSGKTTLLKVIAGHLCYRGEVLFNGVPVDNLPPHKRNLGYLSQELHLFPHLSVRSNVLLSLLFGYRGPEPRSQRAATALRLAQAEHLASFKPDRLSGGERQRAALARCLARYPGLLLLDEPFTALDRRIREHLWQEFTRLRRRLGITTLLVTHDEQEAAILADRVLRLQGSRLVEQFRAFSCMDDQGCSNSGS